MRHADALAAVYETTAVNSAATIHWPAASRRNATYRSLPQSGPQYFDSNTTAHRLSAEYCTTLNDREIRLGSRSTHSMEPSAKIWRHSRSGGILVRRSPEQRVSRAQRNTWTTTVAKGLMQLRNQCALETRGMARQIDANGFRANRAAQIHRFGHSTTTPGTSAWRHQRDVDRTVVGCLVQAEILRGCRHGCVQREH